MDGVPNEKAEPEVTLLLRVMEMKLKVLYGIPYNVVYSLSYASQKSTGHH